MKFRNKNNEKEEKTDKNNNIEIVMGDDSELEISDVGDYMNDLRPKGKEEDKKKNIVIPKLKKKEE